MEDGDTCEQAVEKIQNALKGRGNRTAAVHKLFCSMVQANQTFDAWHKKVYEDQGGGPGGLQDEGVHGIRVTLGAGAQLKARSSEARIRPPEDHN